LSIENHPFVLISFFAMSNVASKTFLTLTLSSNKDAVVVNGRVAMSDVALTTHNGFANQITQ